MGQLGRPSEIYSTIREGRCASCGAWIRLPLLRAHYEVQHPQTLPTEAEIALREIPLVQRIPELVEAGAPLRAAAAACGIPSRTVERWMEWGGAQEEAHGPDADEDDLPGNRRIFWRFWRSVTLAREAAIAHLLRPIEQDPDWRAKAWILERSHPAEFGRIDRLKIGGDRDAGPVRVIHEEDDPSFVDDVTRILHEQGVIPGVDSGHNGTNGNGRRPKKEEA